MKPEKLPTVTAIITTYRRPALVQRAILSVLKQTYPAIRVLVLDDASGDDTEDIVKKIAAQDDRVIYIKHEKNIGMTPNWRYGLEHVDTPYFSFLSDDDLHLPNFYQKAIEYLDNHKDVGFYCGETIIYNEKDQIGRVSGEKWQEGIYYPYDGLLRMMENAISWDGILFRKEVFDEIGTLLDIHSTDYEYLIRASKAFPFYVCHEPCAMFMNHNNRAWWFNNNEWIYFQFFNMAIQILKGLPPEIQASAWVILNRYCITTLKNIYIAHIINRDPLKAYNTALEMKNLSMGSFESIKFLIISKIYYIFPSIISNVLKKRIKNINLIDNKINQKYQLKYRNWIEYKNDLN
jgi:glycosyltransferase involved in cell wall biosynthesis